MMDKTLEEMKEAVYKAGCDLDFEQSHLSYGRQLNEFQSDIDILVDVCSKDTINKLKPYLTDCYTIEELFDIVKG